MRRESKRIRKEKVRTFYEEDLYTLSFHEADDKPYLCIQVGDTFERGLTVNFKWDEFYIVRVKRIEDGHDIVEERVSASTPIEVASVYLAGYEMTDNSAMIEIMNGINTYSDDEAKTDVRRFFEEVKLYLKEHEEF